MRPGLGPPGSGPRLPALEARLQGRRACCCPGGSRRSGCRQQSPSAPAPGALALREAVAHRGVAPQAHAAALLHLAVAEGLAGAVGTEQGHVPWRSPQPLAAAAPGLHGTGLQGVPAGGAAQRRGPRPAANSPRHPGCELHELHTARSQPPAQAARPAPNSWPSHASRVVREPGGTQVGCRRPRQIAKGASETSVIPNGTRALVPAPRPCPSGAGVVCAASPPTLPVPPPPTGPQRAPREPSAGAQGHVHGGAVPTVAPAVGQAHGPGGAAVPQPDDLVLVIDGAGGHWGHAGGARGSAPAGAP